MAQIVRSSDARRDLAEIACYIGDDASVNVTHRGTLTLSPGHSRMTNLILVVCSTWS